MKIFFSNSPNVQFNQWMISLRYINSQTVLNTKWNVIDCLSIIYESCQR